MLFSREGQFVLSSDGVMTPKSVKCDQITNFDYDTNVQPISIGPSIFFVNDRVNYCSVMRYYSLQDVADLKDAEDVAAHVPMYIPKGITRLSGNTTENVVTAISSTTPNIVYCYKFILVNAISEQQAWFKWEFANKNSEVLLAEFVDSEIYLLINSPNGMYLEKALLTGNAVDFSDEPTRLFMDRKKKYTIPQSNKYSDYEDYTEVSLMDIYGAIPSTKDHKYFIVTKDGYVTEVTDWDSNGVFRIQGDMRGVEVFVGLTYKFCVTLSKQSIKRNTDTGGIISEIEGRLQLRYFWLNYSKSGVFECKVDNDLKEKHFKYRFTGRNLGESPTILGADKVHTGKFKFPIQDNNDEVVITVCSDNVQPINLISGGWEGLYIRRNSSV